MILPLTDIVMIAIRLHDLDSEMRSIGIHVEMAENEHATDSPARLPSIYGSVALQTTLTDHAYQSVLSVGSLLKDAEGAPGEAASMVDSLRCDHAAARDRVLALRARLRELYGPLGDSAARLRDQPLDERLERILPAEGEFDIGQVQEQVKRDHHQIADAIAAWRTMNNPRPILYVSESSTRDEIRTALNHLTSQRRLTLKRSIHGVRWTRPAALPLAA